MEKRSGLPLNIDKWDTNFFRTAIARLNVDGKKADRGFSRKLADLLERAADEKVRFLVIKLNNPTGSFEKKIMGAGFRECGESVDLTLNYKKGIGACRVKGINVRMFRPGDFRAVANIARAAFRLSYLYRCGFAGQEDVDRYHTEWVRNLTGDKDSRVFVAQKGERIAGFAAMRVDKDKRQGRIILIAVHEKFRGLGIGNALVRKCIGWGEGKLGTMFVKTQKNNRKAVSLYEKNRFVPVEYEKVFCKDI